MAPRIVEIGEPAIELPHGVVLTTGLTLHDTDSTPEKRVAGRVVPSPRKESAA